MKEGRGRAFAVAVLLIGLTGCGGGGTGEPQASTTPALTIPAGIAPLPAVRPTPTPSVPEPIPDGGEKARWPDTGRNPAGVYSWDGSSCKGSCNIGFMHNGRGGGGSVEIRVQQVPAGGITDGAATTVAGHDGIYARIDPRREWWIVDIEGTTIAIRLEARPGTNEAHLAEAHAIIDSMRTEPQDNDLGFRLVFTLTTNDWDSG